MGIPTKNLRSSVYGVAALTLDRGFLEDNFSYFEAFVLLGYIPIETKNNFYQNEVQFLISSKHFPTVERGRIIPEIKILFEEDKAFDDNELISLSVLWKENDTLVLKHLFN